MDQTSACLSSALLRYRLRKTIRYRIDTDSVSCCQFLLRIGLQRRERSTTFVKGPVYLAAISPLHRSASFEGGTEDLHRHTATKFRDCSISAFSIRVKSRNFARCPPRQGFIEAFSLPSGDLGPVDCSQGLQVRISSDCRWRRSGVHPCISTSNSPLRSN